MLTNEQADMLVTEWLNRATLAGRNGMTSVADAIAQCARDLELVADLTATELRHKPDTGRNNAP